MTVYGKWNVTMQSPMGTREATVEFSAGSELSGWLSAPERSPASGARFPRDAQAVSLGVAWT